jgi:hypothetical protein
MDMTLFTTIAMSFVHACAVLTQLSMNMGEPLFSCGYKDPPFNNRYEVLDEEEDNNDL